MSDFMNNLNKVGMILQAGGGSLAGRDGMGVVREYQAQQEDERRRAAIAGLLQQSGIGGVQRGLIEQLPVGEQAPVILNMLAQMEAQRRAGGAAGAAAARAAAEEEAYNRYASQFMGGGQPQTAPGGFSLGESVTNIVPPSAPLSFGQSAPSAMDMYMPAPPPVAPSAAPTAAPVMPLSFGEAVTAPPPPPDLFTQAQKRIEDLYRAGRPLDPIGAKAWDDAVKFYGGQMEAFAPPEPEAPGNDYEQYLDREIRAGREPVDEFTYRQMVRGPGEQMEVQLADGTIMRVGQGGSSGDPAIDVTSPGAFIDQIDSTLNDPALDWATGTLAWTQVLPGTPMKRFQTRAKQLAGTAFLQARDSLKGQGQITNWESQQASDAIARLDTAQSPEDYRQALLEVRSILAKGMVRQRGWTDTTMGAIMDMSAQEIGALNLESLSREELAAARERMQQIVAMGGQ
jgi:hypothetical protein